MTSYIIWGVDPMVFHEFEFLRWYSVCWLLGMIAGYAIMIKIYRSESIPTIELDRLTIHVMLGAIIGARLGHIVFYDPIHYLNNPLEILPIKMEPSFQFTGLSGLASHGGILGALLALYIYNRTFKKDYLWLLDRVTIAGAALGGFIRIGNLMNSEVIGTPSDLPWAFVFTRVDDIPRHPAQLYEAIFYFAVSASLYFVWKSKKLYENNGAIFGFGVVMIFTQRFLVEFLKENQVPFEDQVTLNMGQSLSIPLVLVGILTTIWSLRKRWSNV